MEALNFSLFEVGSADGLNPTVLVNCQLTLFVKAFFNEEWDNTFCFL